MPSQPKRMFSRLGPWTRGEIYALRARAGWSRERIAKTIKKKDGSSQRLRAVAPLLAKKEANPEWRGEDPSAGSRPR